MSAVSTAYFVMKGNPSPATKFDPERAKVLIREGAALLRSGELMSAEQTYVALEGLADNAHRPDRARLILRRAIAKSYLAWVAELVNQKRYGEVLGAADAVLAHYAAHPPPEDEGFRARATRLRAFALANAGEPEVGEGILRGLADEHAGDAHEDLREVAALALRDLALLRDNAGDSDAALGLYCELERQFADADGHELQHLVAVGQHNQMVVLRERQEYGAALEAADRLLARPPLEPNGPNEELVVNVRFARVRLMRSLGRLGDATRERDRLVAEFEESAVPVERSWVLRALQEKANLLFEAGDFAAAATTNQRVIQLAQREPDSELREYLAVGMARHARALEALGRWPEVEQTCDEMVALLGKANNLSIEEQVAATLSQYGIALRAQGHRERALARAEQVISTFGGCPAHGELSSIMARTRLEQVELLQLMKRGDAAEAADAALAQIADHRVREKVRARVMSASASAYVAAGRLSDAVDVADELVSEFGNSDNETLRQDVVLGLNNKLVALAAQGLTEDAERAYETMVEDFGQQAADALGTVVEELQPATDEQSRLQIAGLLTRQAMVLNDVGQREAALGVVNAVIKEGESETGAASAQVLAAARAIREAIEG